MSEKGKTRTQFVKFEDDKKKKKNTYKTMSSHNIFHRNVYETHISVNRFMKNIIYESTVFGSPCNVVFG